MLAATSSPLIVLRGICMMSRFARQQCESNQAVEPRLTAVEHAVWADYRRCFRWLTVLVFLRQELHAATRRSSCNQPCKPMPNGFIESFNPRFRSVCLVNVELEDKPTDMTNLLLCVCDG